jgi:putative transposase
MRATMTRYRRARTGPTYFFTLVSFRRQPILCLPPIRAELRRALQNVRTTRPFDIDAWVLMPDHLHCIWTLPEGDVDYPTRWALIKNAVSRFAGVSTISADTTSRIKHRDSAIWQRRFYEHEIRDERDFERHMDHVHFNPVRHGARRERGSVAVLDVSPPRARGCVCAGLGWDGTSAVNVVGAG